MGNEKKLTPIELVKGVEPYRQYALSDGIPQFFACLKELMHEQLQQGLENIEQIAWDYDGDNTYIQFFYENVYGFMRGFGNQRVSNKYDTQKKYDTGLIWDDSNFDGLLYLPLYKKLIKWARRLDRSTFALDWLIGFACDFCNIEPSQIQVSFNTTQGVTLTMKRSDDSSLFQALFLSGQERVWDFFPMQNYNKITINLTS